MKLELKNKINFLTCIDTHAMISLSKRGFKMANIYDVAKRAGVSKTLVSRVLNDQVGVSPQSKERILEAMKELKYRPNSLARSLVLQKTSTVGVILDSLSEPYFFDVIEGIEDEIIKSNFKVIFCSARNRGKEKEQYIDFLSNGRTDGAIIYGSDLDDAELIRKRARLDFPFVVVENEVEDAEVNNIIIDNVFGSGLAVDYLAGLGCRKIMHVTGGDTVKVSLNRRHGYLEAMKANGLEEYSQVVECESFGVQIGYRAIAAYIEANGREALPEAIYFSADNSAFGGMMALEDAGFSIPEDVRIVGFDDDKPLNIERRLKKLTTIHQPLYEVGTKAAEILIRQIEAPDTPRQRVVMKPTLIVRETT